jgi:hypothetical protein
MRKLRLIPYAQIRPHFIQLLGTNATYSLQIVHAFESAIRFSRLRNVARGGWADSGHLL